MHESKVMAINAFHGDPRLAIFVAVESTRR